jgi:secreted trypsin-like serine protease
LCLGYENSCINRSQTTATCRGDSGGPGFTGTTLLGVVSRGPTAPCGVEGQKADIFVNIASVQVRNFIKSVTMTSFNATASPAGVSASVRAGGAQARLGRLAPLLLLVAGWVHF